MLEILILVKNLKLNGYAEQQIQQQRKMVTLKTVLRKLSRMHSKRLRKRTYEIKVEIRDRRDKKIQHTLTRSGRGRDERERGSTFCWLSTQQPPTGRPLTSCWCPVLLSGTREGASHPSFQNLELDWPKLVMVFPFSLRFWHVSQRSSLAGSGEWWWGGRGRMGISGMSCFDTTETLGRKVFSQWP